MDQRARKTRFRRAKSTTLKTASLMGIALISLRCDQAASSSLQTAGTVQIDFYGEAVDQDGVHLPGAIIDIDVFSVEGNVFSGRAKEIRNPFQLKSDGNGKFELHCRGGWLKIKASADGYRWLKDNRNYTDLFTNPVYNQFYQFEGWGATLYRSDKDNPAIYIFVKEGAKRVRAKMARGGCEMRADRGEKQNSWKQNVPGYPVEPSIPGLQFGDGDSTPATTRSMP